MRSGREAGRLAEGALRYVASFEDLIGAAQARGLRDEAQLRAFAAGHFRRFGAEEGRGGRVDFEADDYIANHADLRDAFADGGGGRDERATTLHRIVAGFEAGRTDELVLLCARAPPPPPPRPPARPGPPSTTTPHPTTAQDTPNQGREQTASGRRDRRHRVGGSGMAWRHRLATAGERPSDGPDPPGRRSRGTVP